MKKTFFLFLLAIATFCSQAQTNRFRDSTVFYNSVNIATTGKNLYYKNGAVAGYVLTATDTNGKAAWQPATGGDTNNVWKLNGNSNVDSTHFLGTTNGLPLIIQPDSGNVIIGSGTPLLNHKLSVLGNFASEVVIDNETFIIFNAFEDKGVATGFIISRPDTTETQILCQSNGTNQQIILYHQLFDTLKQVIIDSAAIYMIVNDTVVLQVDNYGNFLLPNLKTATDDTDASSQGVPLNGIYEETTTGVLKRRKL